MKKQIHSTNDQNCKLLKPTSSAINETQTANLDEKDPKKKLYSPVSVKKGNLLWRMHLGRCNALKHLGDDVESMVQECLFAKRSVDAVEDSNRLLSEEYGLLRRKYEEILEKNKKDTNIIMALKNSEAHLRDAKTGLTEMRENLLESDFEKQDLDLEKFHLEDEKGKFLLKCRDINKTLYAIDRKQRKIQDLIEKQHEDTESDRLRHEMEMKYLNSSLEEDSYILEEFKKLLQHKDTAIENLQRDIRDGLKVSMEAEQTETHSKENSKDHEKQQELTSVNEEAETSDHEAKEKPPKEKHRKESSVEDSDKKHNAEWRKNKVLLQAAEMENKHLMQMYSTVNKRMYEITSEVLKVKECIAGKEGEKRKLMKKIEELEALVAMKRRKFEIPNRDPARELFLRVEVQRELNEILHDFACRCLSFMQEDEAVNSSMRQEYRESFLSVLRSAKKKEKKHKKKHNEHFEPSEDESI